MTEKINGYINYVLGSEVRIRLYLVLSMKISLYTICHITVYEAEARIMSTHFSTTIFSQFRFPQIVLTTTSSKIEPNLGLDIEKTVIRSKSANNHAALK